MLYLKYETCCGRTHKRTYIYDRSLTNTYLYNYQALEYTDKLRNESRTKDKGYSDKDKGSDKDKVNGLNKGSDKHESKDKGSDKDKYDGLDKGKDKDKEENQCMVDEKDSDRPSGDSGSASGGRIRPPTKDQDRALRSVVEKRLTLLAQVAPLPHANDIYPLYLIHSLPHIYLQQHQSHRLGPSVGVKPCSIRTMTSTTIPTSSSSSASCSSSQRYFLSSHNYLIYA